jgi:hypothetical protein
VESHGGMRAISPCSESLDFALQGFWPRRDTKMVGSTTKAQTNQENYNNSKWERSEKYCTVMTRNEHHWFVGGNIVVLMI